MRLSVQFDEREFDEGIAVLLDGYIRSTTVAASQAALHEAEYELSLTQEQVPVDTGELKASGRVETEEDEEADDEALLLTVGIAYGGPAGSGPEQTEDVDYALVVHEDLEAHHNIGNAKYLEAPVLAEMSSGRALARMAAEIASSLAITMRPFATKEGMFIRGPKGRFMGSTSG